MKTIISLVAAGLLFALAADIRTDHAQGVNAPNAKKAVEEYVKPETTQARRQTLYQYLLNARQADLTNVLRTAMKKDKQVPAALELSAKLQMRDLFSVAEKHLDAHAEHVAALGLLSGELATCLKLVDAWKKADSQSTTYRALRAAFLKYGLEKTVIEEFRKACIDAAGAEERRRDALEVLKTQLGRTDITAEDVETKWVEIAANFEVESARQQVFGIDLFAFGGPMQSTKMSRRGPNLRAEEGGRLTVTQLPEGFVLDDYQYSFWVYPLSDQAQITVDLLKKTTGDRYHIFGLQFRDGSWTTSPQPTDARHAGKARTWVRVVMGVKQKKGQTVPFLTFTVDGKCLVKEAQVADFAPEGLDLQAVAGPMVVSALSLSRP